MISIIMGSTSDLPVMEKAAKFLDEMEIPFEMNALSAHNNANHSLLCCIIFLFLLYPFLL